MHSGGPHQGIETTSDAPKVRQRRKQFRNRSIRKYVSIPWFEKANRFLFVALSAGNDDIFPADQRIGRAMERLRYEPFGEHLAPERGRSAISRASKYLLWGWAPAVLVAGWRHRDWPCHLLRTGRL